MDWSFTTKRSLGVDIGASSIKLVEVLVAGKKKRVENYAEFRFLSGESGFRAFDKDNLLLNSDDVAMVLQTLLKKIGVKQKKVAFSIPDFSTFFTTLSLPPMADAEVAQAVQFEARHYIPLPLSEVVFDWKIIDRQDALPGPKLKILLVAVPLKVLESYQRVANLCQLELKGLEAEAFGLVRSCSPMEKEKVQTPPVCFVDFGWQSTTVSIVENHNLKLSHSLDVSGQSFTSALKEGLKISEQEAERMKRENGFDPKNQEAFQILSDKANLVAMEVEKIIQNFSKDEDKEIKEILLSGGTATIFGLKDYLAGRLQRNVSIAQPFSQFEYPQALEERMQVLGPSFAVALGVALMGAEQ